MTEKLSTQLAEREITNAAWHTLSKSLYPGAAQNSILLVVDYCKARGLDPLKKPCHIVPMKVKDAASGETNWRDVVMPGIYELRTTAQRTGEYLGHSKAEYGEVTEYKQLEVPESCSIVVYRWNKLAAAKAAYPVTVYFSEVCGEKIDGMPNARWTKAPRQMLTKCCEAAALREAFPDELGGEMSAEEMGGQHHTIIDVEPDEDTDDADELNKELDLQPDTEAA